MRQGPRMSLGGRLLWRGVSVAPWGSLASVCVRRGPLPRGTLAPKDRGRAVLLGALCCLLEMLVLLTESFSDTSTVGARGSRAPWGVAGARAETVSRPSRCGGAQVWEFAVEGLVRRCTLMNIVLGEGTGRGLVEGPSSSWGPLREGGTQQFSRCLPSLF